MSTTKLLRAPERPDADAVLSLKNKLRNAYGQSPSTIEEILDDLLRWMYLGQDVSCCGTEILLLCNDPSFLSEVRLKRKLYLYFVKTFANNSNSSPISLMIIHSLMKDFVSTPSVIIKGLALKTLCSVFPSSVYVNDALHRGLSDSEPYVRRIALIGLLKRPCIDDDDSVNTITSKIYSLLSDTDSTVVANALLALEKYNMKINWRLVQSLLSRWEEFDTSGQLLICRVIQHQEWVVVLNNNNRLDDIKAKILTFLDPVFTSSMASSQSIVLEVFKLFLLLYQDCRKMTYQVCRRVCAILITLAETTTADGDSHNYSVYRHVLWIAERFPSLLKGYNCYPSSSCSIHVTRVRMRIAAYAATSQSFLPYLNALKFEIYNSQVFSLRISALECVALLAVRMEAAVTPSMILLAKLLQENENDVDIISQVFVSVTCILRRYPELRVPREITALLLTFATNSKLLSHKEGGSAFLWLVGTQAPFGIKTNDLVSVVEGLVNNTLNESKVVVPAVVVLELQVTLMKAFFAKPKEIKPYLAKVFTIILKEKSNYQSPDVRDRAKYYYRMLREQPTQAQLCFFQAPRRRTCNLATLGSSTWLPFIGLNTISADILPESNAKRVYDTDHHRFQNLQASEEQMLSCFDFMTKEENTNISLALLPNPKITPSDFASHWESIKDFAEDTIELKTRVRTFEKFGITTVASSSGGDTNDHSAKSSRHYYFFAQDTTDGMYFIQYNDAIEKYEVAPCGGRITLKSNNSSSDDDDAMMTYFKLLLSR